MRQARSLNSLLSGVCVVAALAALSVHAQDKSDPAAAKPPEFKLSTALAPAFPLGRAGERWAKLINESAGGAFAIKQYPGATLAGRDPQREFLALRDGAADLAVGSALAWSMQIAALGVYALPWLADEPHELVALVADAALREMIVARLDAVGVVALAFAPLGDRVLATAKSAVMTPADLLGLRVRVLPIPMVIDTFTALGALPQAMNYADAQRAFAAGTLDGQEAMPSTLAAAQVGLAGQKFVTRWGAFTDVMVFAVRRQVWDAWSPEQRGLVRTAAEQAAQKSTAPTREDRALTDLVRQGITVVRLTPAQRDVLHAAAAEALAKWTETIGADVVTAAKAAVATKP